MKLEERLKVLGEKWANLPDCKEANEIADECMDKLQEVLSRIEELEKASGKAEETNQHIREWYSSRMERLGDFIRDEIPEPQKSRCFSIMANGSPDWSEPNTYQGELTKRNHRIEQLEKACAEMRDAFKFPNLVMSSARAISFHARQGDPFGGITSIALADWVGSIADSVERLNNAISTTCGSSYIHRDEIEPLVEALNYGRVVFLRRWAKTTDELETLKTPFDKALAHAERLKGETE